MRDRLEGLSTEKGMGDFLKLLDENGQDNRSIMVKRVFRNQQTNRRKWLLTLLIYSPRLIYNKN